MNNLKVTKIMTDAQLERQKVQVAEARQGLTLMQADGYEPIYLDEMMVTVSTVPKKVWSIKNQPFKIDLKQVNGQTTACIASISARNGVELV